MLTATCYHVYLCQEQDWICCFVCCQVYLLFTVFSEMARHNQGGEIPAENTTPKQHRVQRMLSTRAHCLGKNKNENTTDDDDDDNAVPVIH